MRRRRYLAAVAGATVPLAGCSGGTDRESTGTVTPVPVPDERTRPELDSGTVPAASVGDAHVSRLAGSSATVGVEYEITEDEDPFGVIRIRLAVEGESYFYRGFVRRTLSTGNVSRSFKSVWYDGSMAVIRLLGRGSRLTKYEVEEYDPAPAVERFDRDRIVDVLAGFDPRASAVEGGYELAAGRAAMPERLPAPAGFSGRSDGRLTGRVEPTGVVPALTAEYAIEGGDASGAVAYRVAVSGRGETTVERPSLSETLEWYDVLKERSPTTEVE